MSSPTDAGGMLDGARDAGTAGDGGDAAVTDSGESELGSTDAIASKLITWSCTGRECPWGSSLTGYAVVWPSAPNALATRLGYSVSAGIYLGAEDAHGLAVTLLQGRAAAFAGALAEVSHRSLGDLEVGVPFELSGLRAGEVVSVQDDAPFRYVLSHVAPGVDAGSSSIGPGAVDPTELRNSSLVTWQCIGSPCPWGDSLDGHAAGWPAALDPVATRLGYRVSAPIYLRAGLARGATVSLESGTASVYAGAPDATSHAMLSTINAGESYTVGTLPPGDLVSLQSDSAFTFRLRIHPDADAGSGPDASTVTGMVMNGVSARWRCDIPDCTEPDWEGAAVNWPSWAAYPSNGRAGTNSRTVYTPSGEPLFPYMGAWADGCKVSVTAGRALIIEWRRGAETWRETLLQEGDTHVIQLLAPEDGAMIESNNVDEAFSVAVDNCEPQPR